METENKKKEALAIINRFIDENRNTFQEANMPVFISASDAETSVITYGGGNVIELVETLAGSLSDNKGMLGIMRNAVLAAQLKAIHDGQ